MPEVQEQSPQTPQEFLASLANAPTPEQIAAWKAEVPNGAIRAFSPDGKRCFMLRGMTGLEMKTLQDGVPANSTNKEQDFTVAAVCATCIWTNTTRTGKLDPIGMRASTAGLPATLFSIVENLSDFFAPMQVLNMSFDL